MSFLPLPEYRRSCDLDCGTEMVTKQNHKDECDIHKILNQYQRTGIINHISPHQPQYLDLPDELDYQSSLNLILEAQAAFATLPAEIRDKYGNDPAKFLAALNDPKQREFLEEIGVFEKKPEPKGPMEVRIVPDPVPNAPVSPGGATPAPKSVPAS